MRLITVNLFRALSGTQPFGKRAVAAISGSGLISFHSHLFSSPPIPYENILTVMFNMLAIANSSWEFEKTHRDSSLLKKPRNSSFVFKFTVLLLAPTPTVSM
jgi:hypothetical protein